VNRYAISLARTMSKLLALGLTLEDVVRAVTATPAKMLRLEHLGFGKLAVDAPAHVTVFDVRNEPRELEDAEREVRTVERWIVPETVFVDGVRHDRSAEL
jgi:dihydroorotase